eukprot:TRINITY_DN4977_c0_g1_i1.p1 TRINITY_DN4977_c0_g1~~TRINITY_DN4977_c0_g1_i1.p1  ORF type:complete len:580 (-),score=93.27 TRINITY_DN4977_c0_g1_i1:66-1805(-)
MIDQGETNPYQQGEGQRLSHRVSSPLLIRRTWKDYYTLSALTRKAKFEPTDGSSRDGLAKVLGPADLIAYGVGSTVGAGVFVTTGVVAGIAGPAMLISFLIAAFACLLSALCYAEFAARFPVSGSAYTFSYVALGEAIGWFIGWNLTLEYSISASAVARGWAGYVGKLFLLFNVDLPDWLTGHKLSDLFNFSPLSVLIIVLCTFILIAGVKDSARFNLAMTILNITTLLFVIGVGAYYVDVRNWKPFTPFGLGGAFAGAGTVFFSYIGFDSVTTLAAEVANPSRDLPVGIVGTLSIATALYVAVSLVVTGMVPYALIDQNAPLADAFHYHGNQWAAIIVAFGSVTSLVTSTLCSLLGQPRIYYQMAQDGLFFSPFGTVSARTQAPVFGTWATCIFSCILALFLDLDVLADMISIGTLLAFTVVCGGVVVLRCREPDSPSSIYSEATHHHHTQSFLLSVPFLVFLFFLNSVLVSYLYKYGIEWTWFFLACFPMVAIITILTLKKQPNRPTNTFTCPLVPIIPLIGVLVNTFLICQLKVASIIRVAVWSVVGMAIYFVYGIKNSKLNQVSEDGASSLTSLQ